MKDKKILIVDDESDIIDTISFRLQQEGYACITAGDGIEALKKARTENPGLIILDIMLPKMNGYKVSRLLKFDEKYQHIPIIMLTAKTQDSERITGIETGADGYITKPFDLDTLIAMIQKHMQ
jgi:two-component system, OmpR family, alkaline phosphatase synthesis response regulator PhoP